MALDLETIKTIQALITEMNVNATFLSKLRETKELSFTAGGVTTKINSKTDEESYRMVFEALTRSSSQKLDKLRDRVDELLYSDGEVMAKAEA